MLGGVAVNALVEEPQTPTLRPAMLFQDAHDLESGMLHSPTFTMVLVIRRRILRIAVMASRFSFSICSNKAISSSLTFGFSSATYAGGFAFLMSKVGMRSSLVCASRRICPY